MAEVIARVRKEMQDRLAQVESELATFESLVAEKARLEHALATPPFAVDGQPAVAAASSAPAATKSRRKPAARRPRAPRGANRSAVRDALDTMPGATVAEISAASGVGRAQAYAVLRAGVEKGELKLVELAAGQMGYRIAVEPETAFPPKPQEPVKAEGEEPDDEAISLTRRSPAAT